MTNMIANIVQMLIIPPRRGRSSAGHVMRDAAGPLLPLPYKMRRMKMPLLLIVAVIIFSWVLYRQRSLLKDQQKRLVDLQAQFEKANEKPAFVGISGEACRTGEKDIQRPRLQAE